MNDGFLNVGQRIDGMYPRPVFRPQREANHSLPVKKARIVASSPSICLDIYS
jgi:hypothetical protein